MWLPVNVVSWTSLVVPPGGMTALSHMTEPRNVAARMPWMFPAPMCGCSLHNPTLRQHARQAPAMGGSDIQVMLASNGGSATHGKSTTLT